MVDYSVWDLRNFFTLEEAAHLWFEVDPNDPNKESIPNNTKLKIRNIQRIFKKWCFPPGSSYDPSRRKEREWFKALATNIHQKNINQRPPFLFPKERKSRDDWQDSNKQGLKVTHDPKTLAQISKNPDGGDGNDLAKIVEDQSTTQSLVRRRQKFPNVAEQNYSNLNLRELARLAASFITPYPFVQAVYLCPGIKSFEQNKPYNLLFKVPDVPKDMTWLCSRFRGELSQSELFDLRTVYWDQSGASIDEWMWWEVKNEKDFVAEGLDKFVLSGERIWLCARDAELFEEDAKEEIASVGNNSSPFRHDELGELSKDEAEQALKSLTFSCINEVEFYIGRPNKPKLTVNPSALGCRNAETQEWETLIDILKDPDHKFSLNEGKSTYEGRRKLRDNINKKAVGYLEKALGIKFPVNYKLYSRNDNDGPGVSRFAFGKTKSEIQTKEEQRAAKFSDEELLCGIEEGYQNDSGADSRETNELANLLMEAAKRPHLQEKLQKIFDRWRAVRREFKGEKEEANWDEMPKRDFDKETLSWDPNK